MLQDFYTKQHYARQLRCARSKFRRITSLDLIPEYPSQEELSDDGTIAIKINDTNKKNSIKCSHNNINNNIQQQQQQQQQQQKTLLQYLPLNKNVLLFWPNVFISVIVFIIRIILCIPLSIAAPSFWLCALLWIFWKLMRIPMSLIKWLCFNAEQSIKNGHNNDDNDISNIKSGQANTIKINNNKIHSQNQSKRTMLISCGSTIQTLHLARNFHSSGARVIVFEFDGLFGLARFSTAVDKFYVVPRPSPDNVNTYIVALCHIVRKENVSIYIPVCATNPAYYDSLAKPHLELLGCATFITNVQDTSILDDCLQFYQCCASQNINVPAYTNVISLRELWELYDGNFLQRYRNILMAIGMQGILKHYKYILPNDKRLLQFQHEINEHHQWLVVRDVPGEQYITCTTIKNSQVVANVSCRVDHQTKNLIPIVENNGKCNKTSAKVVSDTTLIEHWLKIFFAKVRFQRPINCHISFRLVKCKNTNEFLPMGVRLGVSLPYICYNRSHALTLYRTIKCAHIGSLQFASIITNRLENTSAEKSMSLITSSSTSSSLKNCLKSSWPNAYNNGTVLDKRIALFAYWDPMPYCAYYHFQLPLESVKNFIQKKRHQKHNAKYLMQPNNTNATTTQPITYQ